MQGAQLVSGAGVQSQNCASSKHSCLTQPCCFCEDSESGFLGGFAAHGLLSSLSQGQAQ